MLLWISCLAPDCGSNRLAMTGLQALPICRLSWPHRRIAARSRAASRRIDVARNIGPGTRLWEAACRRWRCDRRSRCMGLAGLIVGSPPAAEQPPTGLMSPKVSGLAPDCGRQLCWRLRSNRQRRCAGFTGPVASRAPSHRMGVRRETGEPFWIEFHTRCRAFYCVRKGSVHHALDQALLLSQGSLSGIDA